MRFVDSQIPTGGIARDSKTSFKNGVLTELVKFQCRRYSPDGRKLNFPDKIVIVFTGVKNRISVGVVLFI
jgi:hypothetical protein